MFGEELGVFGADEHGSSAFQLKFDAGVTRDRIGAFASCPHSNAPTSVFWNGTVGFGLCGFDVSEGNKPVDERPEPNPNTFRLDARDKPHAE